jgi:solute carrier family 13 (sodium-dependent dicarboxylate transporter), member 2/3/5
MFSKKTSSFLLLIALLGFFYFQWTEQPAALTAEAWKLLGVVWLVILFWIAELFPFAVVALLPLLLFPVLGIMSFPKATASYANPVIFLFLGGFLMANALEKTGLHKRIALYIIYLTGRNIAGVLLGFMLATALLSMWISNTATTVMMTAIAIPALGWLLPDNNGGTQKIFASYFLLSIAYAAGIGGVATLIGTPPNAVLYGLLSSEYDISLSFIGWMGYGLPIAGLMFAITYLLYRLKINKLGLDTNNTNFRQRVKPELDRLGSVTYNEKWIMGVFAIAIFLWVSRSMINDLMGADIIDDAMIALLAGVIPFFITEKGKVSHIMSWEDTRNLPWNILLLFGGGLCLASAMGQTGLVNTAANFLVNYFGHQPILFLGVLSLVMLLLTELMGNVALATLFLPLAFQVADKMGLPVEYYAFPVTIASSFAFMLPIATPPNAVVYSKGYFDVLFMARRGVWLNLIGWLVICIYSYIYFL